MIESSKAVAPWRADIRTRCLAAHAGPPLVGALIVKLCFTMPRPRRRPEAPHPASSETPRPGQADPRRLRHHHQRGGDGAVTNCLICTKTSQTYACDPCADALCEQLRMLPWLASQLLVAYSRQSKLTTTGRRTKGAEQPLGYGPAAKHAHDRLHAEVVGWVRDLHEGREDWPADTVVAMTVWLLRRRPRLQVHAAVDELRRSVEQVVQAGLERINPEPDEPTYGICEADTDYGPCPGYLYGAPDADWVRCQRCGAQHPTEARREWMRHRMSVFYFRAATLARLLPRLIQRPVSASNIRNWATDGRPIRTDRDADGFPTYHCGDVIAVAAATPKRDRQPGRPQDDAPAEAALLAG